MIKDISGKVNSAFLKSHLWNQESFLQRLNQLESLIQGATKDWDDYAQENWGIILVNNKPAAFINRLYPLIFIQENLKNIKLPIDDLEVVIFCDPDKEAYSIGSSLFEQWSNGRSKTGGLKENSLSASDIWWATIL
jgi:hypothetical protein